MNFCISTVEYFESIGFSTIGWRKSIDGTKAIAHDRFVKVLIPEYLTDENIATYQCPSAELDNILNSNEWKIAE